VSVIGRFADKGQRRGEAVADVGAHGPDEAHGLARPVPEAVVVPPVPGVPDVGPSARGVGRCGDEEGGPAGDGAEGEGGGEGGDVGEEGGRTVVLVGLVRALCRRSILPHSEHEQRNARRSR
jgi:hypothetical protein